MKEKCSICEKEKELPYETPVDIPFFNGGHHCEDCEQWLLTGELPSD